jgi:gliding motility-associated-like protein
MPLGTGADNSTFSMKIYDRWGQIVFESKSFEEPWDGTMKNGKPAPMGNYIWVSHFFDIQGFEHNQKGQVLLIR